MSLQSSICIGSKHHLQFFHSAKWVESSDPMYFLRPTVGLNFQTYCLISLTIASSQLRAILSTGWSNTLFQLLIYFFSLILSMYTQPGILVKDISILWSLENSLFSLWQYKLWCNSRVNMTQMWIEPPLPITWEYLVAAVISPLWLMPWWAFY